MQPLTLTVDFFQERVVWLCSPTLCPETFLKNAQNV